MMNHMSEMMPWMMGGMGVITLLIVIALVLAIAALVRHLFF
jgi:hypothetical protein